MDQQVSEVLRYFLHHPQAADSLEGVARWRLRQETIWQRVAEVQEALTRLVVCGFLSRECIGGERSIYRLNPRRLAEARRLLERMENDADGARAAAAGRPRKPVSE